MAEPTPWAPHMTCACPSPDEHNCVRARGQGYSDTSDSYFDPFDSYEYDGCSCCCHDFVAEEEAARAEEEG